ncbi:protein TASOR [Trichomycterus rosablanca]|uniref:protein TASOR n=1 Tax=Trichomycterus rosablanca TaxID=2290929 RepID=UPI002F354534
MACNLNEDRKFERDAVQPGASCPDSCEQSSTSSATTSEQNGDQAAGCEEEPTPEADPCERRRSGLSELRNCAASPVPLHRSAAEEWSRKGFHIPRKNKERRGLLQPLALDSREYEELMKILSSSYLDASSRGSFTYTKAYLIHNELLEKEFVEKKRELKQAGRGDAELTDSYAFLMPDPNKTHWICEKGLSAGHARISNLGNPVKGVYLSKYSDLLQINPFEAGASGEIIIFKVMKGKSKTLFENMPKGNLDPSLKFECHIHKNASKVTSLLSYRAFELTQQYFYEFAFDEPRSRPRHVCPYALVSFQFKGKESSTGAHRLSSSVYEGHRGRRRYTVWSGPLVNKGEELYHVCIRSASSPILPFKLPDKIDISVAMHIDQVKRKIPATLLSWDTYSGTQEAMKCGMYCSLFNVMAKNKQGRCLSSLLQKMEKDKTVFVKPLVERGFLLLLASSHLHSSNERRGRYDRGLYALFIYQESRMTTRLLSPSMCQLGSLKQDSLVSLEPKDPITAHLDTYVPALHHALFKFRSSPPKDLASAVKSQALEYLSLKEQGSTRLFSMPEYRLRHDERPHPYLVTRPKSLDSVLKAYIHTPAYFQLAMECLRPGPEDNGPAMEDEFSPVSDWSSGSAKPTLVQSNGSGAQRPQGEYNKEKMEKLLQLIHMHKRTQGKEDGGSQERSDDWEPVGHKRKFEGEGSAGVSKYQKSENLSNGEPGRAPLVDKQSSLLTMMDSVGLCDTDFRKHVSQNASIMDTQNLLKLFLTAVKKVAQTSVSDASGSDADPSLYGQVQDCLTLESVGELSRHAEGETAIHDILKNHMECSISSKGIDVCSPSSSIEHQMQRSAEIAQSCHDRLEQRAGSTVLGTVNEGRTSETDRSVPAAGKTLDSILDQEFQTLCTCIQEQLDKQKIVYVSQPALPHQEAVPDRLGSTFSPYIVKYVSPLPVQGYVNTLCEQINHMISPPGFHPNPALAGPPFSSAALFPVTSSSIAATPSVTAPLTVSPLAPLHSSQELLHKPVNTPPASTLSPTPAPKQHPSPCRKPHMGNVNKKKTDSQVENVVDSPKALPSSRRTGVPPIPEISPEPTQTGAAGNNVIGQIKPDVLCTLVEIMQMNAVRFYIQPGEEEENQLFTEIKAYLKSLGNIECDPQTYLKNNCQQKFMVIVRNEDIASHIHKVPALVSLKKLPTVYFAGVDSLDDVKNRTYNELFLSGGLIVSDEAILNPDFITLEKLQKFLQFLEEQSGSWKWKVHCKTQKKLKELSRLNSKSLDLLNLLTVYQKKHLVEFLPYHECDAPSRQAPDPDCLVKLQAQHTQLRHVIFLTDSSTDVAKFSSNSVITASIKDIMTDFERLISITKADVPTLPSYPASAAMDACIDEEDMSLDSDEEPSAQVESKAEEKTTTISSPPQSEKFQPAAPPIPDPEPSSSCPIDYSALKEAISQYKACKQAATPIPEGDENPASFGVNPHQSYLFPSSAQWSPYSGSPSYPFSSAFSPLACLTSKGQEYPVTSSQTPSITMSLNQPPPIPVSLNQPPPIPVSLNQPPHIPVSLNQPPPMPVILNQPPPIPVILNQPPPIPLSLNQPPPIPVSLNQPPPIPLSLNQPPPIPVSLNQPPPIPVSLNQPPPIPVSLNQPPHFPVSLNQPPPIPLSLNQPPHFPVSLNQPPPIPLPQVSYQENFSTNPAHHSPSQTFSGVKDRVPEVASCPQSVLQTDESQPAMSGTQDTQPKAMEPLPSYLDVPIFPPLPPPPPVPPMFKWPPPAEAQHSFAPDANKASFEQNEAAPLNTIPSDGLTTDSKFEGSSSGTAPPSGIEMGRTSGSVTPSSQGSRTPGGFFTENQRIVRTPVHTQTGRGMSGRGGAIPRGHPPRQGVNMPPMCRGGPQRPGMHSGVRPFSPRGPMPRPMNMWRGGPDFRGRGMPPMPMRSRPFRGPMRGGAPSNWGFNGPPNNYY